jgi:hypothetical protein
MRQTQAVIERVKQVSATHQHLALTVDPSLGQIKPGQTLLALRPAPAPMREVWWPVSAAKQSIVIERPLRERYEPGTTVDVIGAVGKPFRFRRTLRAALLLALDTSPTPLLFTISHLLSQKSSVTLVLLGAAADYSTEHLAPEVEIVRGDADLNFPNRVTTVGWADQVFAVVNPLDELAQFSRIWELFRSLRADVPSNYLFGIFRPPLPCGVGACSACMVKGRGGAYMLACADGPAFDLGEVSL